MPNEDTTLLKYIELCCFLSAYFKLTVLRRDDDWQRSANEIVENCTFRCVETIIRQISQLLDELSGEALLSWVTRFAAGWECRSPQDAKQCLFRLQNELEEAMSRREQQQSYLLVA
ncbi:MAG TPA: hypothetical protein VD907_00905 [Verrucomicrobiae bacterium]|nr:hypothetical protein [Verrucomicrobiae bacterium]